MIEVWGIWDHLSSHAKAVQEWQAKSDYILVNHGIRRCSKPLCENRLLSARSNQVRLCLPHLAHERTGGKRS